VRGGGGFSGGEGKLAVDAREGACAARLAAGGRGGRNHGEGGGRLASGNSGFTTSRW
jgi:hypothetical protein